MPDTTLKSNTAPLHYPKYNGQAFAETKIQNVDYYIHLIKMHKYLMEGSKAHASSLFSAVSSDRMRSNGHKWKFRKFH